MNNSYHICPAEPCEHALKIASRFPNVNGMLVVTAENGNKLLETLERYRSELAELRGRQQPVPASTKAEEV